MKKFLLATCATFALSGTALASEFDLRGADVTGQIWYGWEPGFSEWFPARVAGSADFGLGGDFFAQIDLAAHGYFGMGGPTTALGGSGTVHIGYDMGDWALGAFVGATYWDIWDSSYNVGVEAVGQFGDFEVEAFALHRRDFGGFWWETNAQLHGRYQIDGNWSVGAGGAFLVDNWGETLVQGLANVRYDLSDDCFVEAGYTYSHDSIWGPAHAVGIKFTKVFGGGATFGDRDYVATYNGY